MTRTITIEFSSVEIRAEIWEIYKAVGRDMDEAAKVTTRSLGMFYVEKYNLGKYCFENALDWTLGIFAMQLFKKAKTDKKHYRATKTFEI